MLTNNNALMINRFTCRNALGYMTDMNSHYKYHSLEISILATSCFRFIIIYYNEL